MRISKKLMEGIMWIAMHDNAGNGDSAEEVAEYVTTSMLADMFNKDQHELGRKIYETRQWLFETGKL